MTDIDDVLTEHDTISVQMDKETDKAFSERTVYWKIVNKYIIDSIRFSLKSEGLTHIADMSGVYQMVQRLRNQYKFKGYTSREILWRTMSRTTLNNCKDMTDWVKTIKKVKVSLMKLDSIISQWIVTIIFLHSLPSFYDSFVEIVINSRDKDVNERPLKSDFDDMCERVLNRERRQKVLVIDQFNFKVLKAAEKTNSTNFNVNSNFKPKSQGKGEGKRIKCDECNWFHRGDCWMAHSKKANQAWRDKNKDRLIEF